jgi:predicted  nucleic acid-binding Zn ribbon protein
MKPVAWTDGKLCLSFAESDVCPIPLYTAPRELSDDEIKTLHDETSWWGVTDPVKFARAILKKASEK